MQLQNSTMFQQNFNFSRSPLQKTGNALLFSSSRTNNRTLCCFSQLSCSIDNISDVLHNKVLVAATVSAAIGQLSKPFTSIIFYGKKFDFKAAIRAGGFPSTHSSAAVATATSLALERGFSDAIFGLAVVYASLIMYDAQGVRREVGTHAKELNKVLLRARSSLSTSSRNDVNDFPNSHSRESSPKENVDTIFLENQSSLRDSTNSSLLLKSDKKTIIDSSVRSDIVLFDEGGAENVAYISLPLKESIGHTELEVAAGALLGFLVSLAICPYV